MSLAVLFNIPESAEDFLTFSFHNQDQHALIVRAVFTNRGIRLPLYLMDPIPPSDPGDWLRTHQQAHNDFNGVLGIDGVDLTSVDFNDPEQLASWSRLHGEEHRQAADILRIG